MIFDSGFSAYLFWMIFQSFWVLTIAMRMLKWADSKL